MLQIINPINPQWGWALISIKMLLANYLKKTFYWNICYTHFHFRKYFQM